MKQLFLIAMSLFMIACEPKDNKLVTPNRTGSAGQQAAGNPQSLRVGTYGLPILTAQTFEKMGALVQECLIGVQNGEISSATSGEVIRFSCDLIRQHEHTTAGVTHILNEEWNLKIYFPVQTTIFDLSSLKSVFGISKRGLHLGRFKNEVLKTTQSADQFQINHQDGALNFRMAQIFEVGTSRDSYFMTHNAAGKIQIEEARWKFDFEANYKYLNQTKLYQLKSTHMDLLWNTKKCADFSGEVDVQDKQVLATIRLQSDSARLVTKDRPWQQSLVSCTNREFNIQNFDFLFY